MRIPRSRTITSARHALNMWFVISAERPERIAEVAETIEGETGLTVHRMPKLNEFFVGFRVEV